MCSVELDFVLFPFSRWLNIQGHLSYCGQGSPFRSLSIGHETGLGKRCGQCNSTAS
ncbi:unnamed protein product [Hymenolepis diminuta]|uniref:Uncharacterized protein n=1 Tax=Hymenolepis diminuta TaxID=6216 RepID=A0A564Y1F7_HYMDI|nr:unnamed protein product [Hymenolepis diminuta]